MKRFILALIVFVILTGSAFADTMITDFTAETSPDTADVLWLTVDISTSAADRKITLGNLLLWMATQDWTMSGTWTGDIVGNASTATLASTVVVVDGTDTSSYPLIVDSVSGSLAAKTDAGLTYNAGTGVLTATGFSGPLTGAVTGNADTATALASNPTDCSANQFANAIVASGNLTCAALTDADVPDTITASSYLPLAGGDVVATVGFKGDGSTTKGNFRLYDLDNSAYVAVTPDDATTTWSMVLPATSPTGLARFDAGVVTASDTIASTAVGGFSNSLAVCSDGSGNAVTCAAQNMITTGYMDGKLHVVVVTEDTTITATSTNQSVYYINGADSARTFVLPAAIAGLAYCFANALYAKSLIIDPATGDQIILAGAAATAGEYVESTSAASTDKICVLAIDTTYWLVTGSTGTWAEDTPP